MRSVQERFRKNKDKYGDEILTTYTWVHLSSVSTVCPPAMKLFVRESQHSHCGPKVDTHSPLAVITNEAWHLNDTNTNDIIVIDGDTVQNDRRYKNRQDITPKPKNQYAELIKLLKFTNLTKLNSLLEAFEKPDEFEKIT